MENIIAKQSGETISSDVKFSNTIVSEIELTNGEITQVVTLFNHRDVNFEEMNIGINMTFSRCGNVAKSKNTFCSLKSGKINPFGLFDEIAWEHKEQL